MCFVILLYCFKYTVIFLCMVLICVFIRASLQETALNGFLVITIAQKPNVCLTDLYSNANTLVCE